MTEQLAPEITAPIQAVLDLAAGIETASGGTILPGFALGWTSALAPEMPAHELTHRDGTGLDLDCPGADPAVVAAWARTLDVVVDAVELPTAVHVTLRPGTVDLSGCPKPAKKKKSAEEPVAE